MLKNSLFLSGKPKLLLNINKREEKVKNNQFLKDSREKCVLASAAPELTQASGRKPKSFNLQGTQGSPGRSWLQGTCQIPMCMEQGKDTFRSKEPRSNVLHLFFFFSFFSHTHSMHRVPTQATAVPALHPKATRELRMVFHLKVACVRLCKEGASRQRRTEFGGNNSPSPQAFGE